MEQIATYIQSMNRHYPRTDASSLAADLVSVEGEAMFGDGRLRWLHDCSGLLVRYAVRIGSVLVAATRVATHACSSTTHGASGVAIEDEDRWRG
ncbi:uncharacterized protein B0H18DRAFT_1071111 [Fomitopsis serialis]|uniref:uncharacterized protein n=1 Tax=Fomitopsis serialis TaxID=139415 RepID=UPI0020073B1D|nr:uncharacterized protein B0H18DRAFT_1071111 [Neoantrodia serialis]KAH9910300.1 hypothetical protein B0H18DRAFT_1071111 [Neoantrodia serialis]